MPFLHDGVEEIADYNSSGTLLRRYVHGPGVDEYLVMYTGTGTASKSYFHANHQGSIVAMSDSTGNVTEQHSYDSYGNSATLTGAPFRYTGRRLDAETGLYYYRARYYSPAIGRFLQTDPIGYGDGLNWYAYVGNDPGNNVDPTGKVVNVIKVKAEFFILLGVSVDGGIYFGINSEKNIDFGLTGSVEGGIGFDVGVGGTYVIGDINTNTDDLNGVFGKIEGGIGPVSVAITATNPSNPQENSIFGRGGLSKEVSGELSPLPISGTVTVGIGGKFGLQDIFRIFKNIFGSNDSSEPGSDVVNSLQNNNGGVNKENEKTTRRVSDYVGTVTCEKSHRVAGSTSLCN